MDNDVVMEGRDIGSYVFPNAQYKFYLTADVEIRAKRRYEENKLSHIDYKKVLFDLKKRDKIDKSRKYSPLVISDEAIIIDTTFLSIEEQVEKIIKIINK